MNYFLKFVGILGVAIGIAFGCFQAFMIFICLNWWLGYDYRASVALAVLLILIPSSTELLSEKISFDFLSRHLLLAKFLAFSTSAKWQLINITLVFLGSWKGLHWEWWQAALLIVGMLVLPKLTVITASLIFRSISKNGATADQ